MGVVLFDQDFHRLEDQSRVVGQQTVNQVEYRALILALDVAAKHTRGEVVCYLDSEVVVGQMTGRFRLVNDGLRALFHTVKEHERPFESVAYVRVPREDQRHRQAHQLANDALNGRCSEVPATIDSLQTFQ